MTTNGISKTWLIGVLSTIVIMGGGGWIGSVHWQVAQIKMDREQDTKATNEIRQDTAVVKERLRRVEDDTKDIKQEQKEQTRKLDELLRRVR